MLEQFLEYFHLASMVVMLPDDYDALQQYFDFIFKYASDEEIKKRGAANFKVCEDGFHCGRIDECRRVIVYFDESGAPIDSEPYTGKYTYDLIRKKWGKERIEENI